MSGVTYKKAGVDIDKADSFIKKIITLIEKTNHPEVLGKNGLTVWEIGALTVGSKQVKFEK